MVKSKAFPNDTFKSQDDYFNFAINNNVFGLDAYNLKKKMAKQIIPIPRIKKSPSSLEAKHEV